MLSFEQLEKLSTKRLLAYKRKHYSHKLIPEDHVVDCDCHLCVWERDTIKQHNDELEQIKKILSTREHIERN
jgi:hypothetical protein